MDVVGGIGPGVGATVLGGTDFAGSAGAGAGDGAGGGVGAGSMPGIVSIERALGGSPMPKMPGTQLVHCGIA